MNTKMPTDAWARVPIKYLATCNDDTLPEDTSPDKALWYVDIGNVQHEAGIIGGEEVLFQDAPSRARRLVRDGDVIASTVRTYLRAIAHIENPPDNLVVSTGFAVLRPGSTLEPRFFGYAMQSETLIDEIVARSTGVSYPAIAASDLVRLALPLPDKDDQTQIANFLDRETAMADALVSKYERLIELVEEKRAALITHTVTKGLHRNTAMKDSGVEWLGQMPSHWTMTRLKFISKITVGIVVDPSSYFAPEGLPFLHGNNISDGFLNLDGVKYISPADSDLNFKSRLTAGDLVCMRVGEPGRSAVVTPECEGGNCASVLLLRKSPKFDSNWLRLFLNSAGRTQVLRDQNGTAQQVLNVSQAINILIPLPPIEEQRSIAERMIAAEDRFLQQIDRARRAIDLLREHRAALITAAVTGRIDVRTYKAKDPEEVVA